MKNNVIYMVTITILSCLVELTFVFYFVDGLGQLSDGQTGPDNREDPRGFQWVRRSFD